MVPDPLYCARDEPWTTSHWYDVLEKLKVPALKLNSVLPLGVLAPLRYFETNPKFARPVAPLHTGPDVHAPAGDMIHPPPVTKPAFGSYTTTYLKSCDTPLCSSSTTTV